MDEGLTRKKDIFSNDIFILEKLETEDVFNDSFYLCRKDFKDIENINLEFAQIYKEYINHLYDVNLEVVENYVIALDYENDKRVALINIPKFKTNNKKKILFNFKPYINKQRA